MCTVVWVRGFSFSFFLFRWHQTTNTKQQERAGNSCWQREVRWFSLWVLIVLANEFARVWTSFEVVVYRALVHWRGAIGNHGWEGGYLLYMRMSGFQRAEGGIRTSDTLPYSDSFQRRFASSHSWTRYWCQNGSTVAPKGSKLESTKTLRSLKYWRWMLNIWGEYRCVVRLLSCKQKIKQAADNILIFNMGQRAKYHV